MDENRRVQRAEGNKSEPLVLLLSCNGLCTQWGGKKRRSHSRCKHTCNPSTDFVLVLGPPVGLYIVMIKRKQRAEMQESQAQAQRQGTALYSGEKWPHLRHLLYHSRITNSTSEFKAGAPFRAPYRASKYSSKTCHYHQFAATVLGVNIDFEVPLAVSAVVLLLLLVESSFLYIIVSVRASPCPGLSCDKAARTGTRMVRGDTQPRMYLYRGYPRCMD